MTILPAGAQTFTSPHSSLSWIHHRAEFGNSSFTRRQDQARRTELTRRRTVQMKVKDGVMNKTSMEPFEKGREKEHVLQGIAATAVSPNTAQPIPQ